MAEKDLVVKEKIEHSGIFSFSGVYSFMHSWLKDQEDYIVTEEKYSEKVSGNAREIEIKWVAFKKMGDYFKIEMTLEFKATDLTDVEVETEGQKKRTNKGKFAVELKGAVIKDYQSKWEDKPINKFLREVYNKYVIPQRVENVEIKIITDVKKLKEETKTFLELSGKR